MSAQLYDGAGVHIVRGTPDDEELAALVAGLAAAYSSLANFHNGSEESGDAARWIYGSRGVSWNEHSAPASWTWSSRR